jgi:serine/threonine protein kinase
MGEIMIDVGQTVGNYNITAKLGEGGMGTVFLAEHPVIGSKVALKAILPQFARSAEVFSRFVNEAKAVNQIGHDHIIDITDFGITSAGDYYFMMEYLEGQGLGEAISKNGAFAPARALNIAVQIADALDASHAHGIIHRDLKPENIFLKIHDGVEDFVKVLDFGLAKLTSSEDEPSHSRTGAVMGTPYYMSPEQCEGRAEIDHRSDIYSLGVILFEMLTGMIPFGGQGHGEIIIKHVTVPPPSIRSLVPGLSRALDMILFRVLSKAPALRFQSMGELRQALIDPESYASVTPFPDASEDMSGRVRAALPMARTALSVRVGSGSSPLYVEGLGPAPSTFRDSTGEVWVREDEAKDQGGHRGRTALLLGLVLAAAGVVGVKYRNQARTFVAAASAPSNPATVRVNFSSNPDGASVVRADGTVLGVTPLSADVPYGDKAVEYVIRLDGYVPKVTSIVPNVASPIFALLERDQPAPWVEPVAPASKPASASGVAGDAPSAGAEKRATVRAISHHSLRVAAEPGLPPRPDGDETLAPSPQQ